MVTFKQLEALQWIAQLGGFEAAASKLYTTQSAVSKRIQELESAFGTQLFDRSRRGARLTEKGQEMVALAEELLNQRSFFIERFSQPGVLKRRVRIGVTELTAMTWLPSLVRLIQQNYPKVTLEPDVDMSVNLTNKLATDRIDLIVVPDTFFDSHFTKLTLGQVENAWMCKPGLIRRSTGKRLSLTELDDHTVLIQGELSGSGIVYDHWLTSQGVAFRNVISTNSLVANVGLAIAGLGVSYFPVRCVSDLITRGLLVMLRTDPPLPKVNYVAMYRNDRGGTLIPSIAGLARQSCNFSGLFQGQ